MQGGVDELGRRGNDDGIEVFIQTDTNGPRVGQKACAGGFEQGFFQGPKLEEVTWLIGGRKRGQVGQFIVCKDVASYFVAGKIGVDEFDVDAEGVVAGDGDGGQVAGMGEIELPAADPGEGGFAPGFVSEGDFIRRRARITAQEEAQAGAAGNETSLVFLELEAAGALAFGGGKKAAQIAQGGIDGGERDLPDVDFSRPDGITAGR